jgi:predicted Fe-S protein YdhL (DUF1289 family)
MRSDLPGIVTPCTRRCAMSPLTNTCSGCGRTREQIAAWPHLDYASRLKIMRDLKTSTSSPVSVSA